MSSIVMLDVGAESVPRRALVGGKREVRRMKGFGAEYNKMVQAITYSIIRNVHFLWKTRLGTRTE